jgi:hypothetical protein
MFEQKVEQWFDHILTRHESTHELLKELMMTAADLKTAIDNLTAAVAKVEAEVTALKSQQALIDQPMLDADVAAVQAAADKLNAV